MERDFAKEIDELKKEISEIKELLTKNKGNSSSDNSSEKPEMIGHVQKMPDMHKDKNIMSILSRLEDSCGNNKQTGAITYLGVYDSGGRQS